MPALPRPARPRRSPDGRMPLRQHLLELRNRLLIAGVAVSLGAVAGWFVYDPVLAALVQPLKAMAEQRNQQVSPNFGTVGAAFDFRLKISVYIGILLSSPIWIYQLWAFITPGLHRGERRYALAFMSAAVPLFVGGAYFGYFFIPQAVRFFVAFTPDGFSNIIDAQVYLTFVTQLILSFGACFLMPLVLVALNLVGLVSGRTLARSWRWMLVGSLTFSALVTPTPDVVMMFMMASPLMGLFAVAVAIALISDRIRGRRDESFADLPDDQASPL